ncbi:MAG: Spy/CpxP family protein refolding chaperone [Deferribacteres bacterium]|nr:Spy/CpxP family protein refolding chaperone [candidate division KSB1 bacterium]MCB9510711.1 Spy/CpxP family protein refolding chaperone [Deferribacteres bacterium]
MKKYSAFVAATCLMLIASLAIAQPRQRQFQKQGGPAKGAFMAEALGLTDVQKEQIQGIHSAAQKERIDRQAKMKIARIELRELMVADTPDQGKIDAKVNELSTLQASMMKARVHNQLAVQKILTPEQRKKAKALRLQHGGRGMRGKARFERRGSGGARGNRPLGGPGTGAVEEQEN